MFLFYLYYMLWSVGLVSYGDIVLCCLTTLSTRCQLYRDGQFSWWRKPEYLEKTIGLPQVTDKNFITHCCIEYTSQSTGFEFTPSVVIGTDCICSCKPNSHHDHYGSCRHCGCLYYCVDI